MENLEKEIREVESRLEELKQKRREKEEQTNIGVVSIIDDRLKLDLLLDENDFSEKHIEKLTQIVNDLQDLLLDVYKDVNRK